MNSIDMVDLEHLYTLLGRAYGNNVALDSSAVYHLAQILEEVIKRLDMLEAKQ